MTGCCYAVDSVNLCSVDVCHEICNRAERPPPPFPPVPAPDCRCVPGYQRSRIGVGTWELRTLATYTIACRTQKERGLYNTPACTCTSTCHAFWRLHRSGAISTFLHGVEYQAGGFPIQKGAGLAKWPDLILASRVSRWADMFPFRQAIHLGAIGLVENILTEGICKHGSAPSSQPPHPRAEDLRFKR